mmetsp:Transcript_23161/g.54764  ORF Transcript_23161/g.54764 Transcript_23161/m.54764 type:complete len:211 (-) Transcript_23161:22-654(-)
MCDSSHRVFVFLVKGLMVSEFICMLPLSSMMNSKLAYSLSIMSLFISPMGTSYFPKMAPSSSTISSGAMPASKLISGSCIISMVASVDAARGMLSPMSSFSFMWSSMLQTTGSEFILAGTTIAATGTSPGVAAPMPPTLFFHWIYAGFIFMTPLILTYFFGGPSIFVSILFSMFCWLGDSCLLESLCSLCVVLMGWFLLMCLVEDQSNVS